MWDLIRQEADDRGETSTDVILRALREHFRSYPSGD